MIDDWTDKYPPTSIEKKKRFNDYLQEDLKLSDEQIKEVKFYLDLHRQKERTVRALTDPDFNKVNQ